MMREHLEQLLDDLDAISERHEEIEDTDVRERIHEVIQAKFVRDDEGSVSAELGMFSPHGNLEVQAALQRFVTAPGVLDFKSKTTDPQARLDAFEDGQVLSARGSSFDDYFGSTR